MLRLKRLFSLFSCFMPQKRNKYFVNKLKSSKSGRKTCFFRQIGKMKKLKIEWKAFLVRDRFQPFFSVPFFCRCKKRNC